MSTARGEPIFQAKDVVIRFTLRGRTLTAVRGASLDLYEGETLALVGESGCGKSVLTKSFLGMLDKNGALASGRLIYRGEDISAYRTETEWLKVRGRKIAMVFQDPMTSLNPVRTVGEQIAETITWHFRTNAADSRVKAIELLERVGIEDAAARYRQYPQAFSGGMRQRAVIATAIACQPDILICDEPTTALDVTVQAQILKLIQDLQKQFGMTVIYITHDLGVVASVADWVAVMYAGQIVEYGSAREVFHEPAHPYTQALLRALPRPDEKGRALYAIPGSPPNLFKSIAGDAFAPRNPQAMVIDTEQEPPMFDITPTHRAKTWLLHPLAAGYASMLSKREEREAGANAVEAPAARSVSTETLLSVKHLSVSFKLGRRSFKAVDDVSFDVKRGDTLSLVGESGSGKTTIGRAVTRIYQHSKGEIDYQGQSITGKLDARKTRELHMRMQMIFQDPMASLNERAKVDYIISEGLYNYHLFDNEADRLAKVEAIMREVGLSMDFASRFPHEFSGGQRQRIGIARSLVMSPEFIVADEPVSALDVSIRAQVINLLNRLKREHNLTYLFIAHDLSLVRHISDRVAVIRKGRLMELAGCDALFDRPLHPYTRSLLSAAPTPDPDIQREKRLVVYDPTAHNYDRNPPEWAEVEPGHWLLANAAERARWLDEAAG
ncbi:ABC transporter ATP-binding protein [Clostridia bacterium]|nr:ABC transporter ATP-binding protein [Clostridia bacterium]